ncbi:hypothetical protein B0H13DRAFT_2309359 [Mycena leptocephala]|nr:hypothetical protein B0H13DRAFT_2309359 [Mycena leptocephala]
MCARIPRWGRVASQTDYVTPEIGTRSPADGATCVCVLAIKWGIARSEPGPPATHIVCSGRGHQPSLLTPRPIIPSLSLWTPRLCAFRPPLTASHLHQYELLLPRAVRRLIYALHTPPSGPSSFHASLVPIARFECSDARRAVRPVHVCARGPATLPTAPTHLAAEDGRAWAMRMLWVGLDVPEPYSPAYAMRGDTPSGVGVLVASRCPLSVHPSAHLALISAIPIPILESKNASTYLACQPFRLSIVNEVRLCLLLAPASTRYSSPSDPFPPLLFLDLPFLPLPLLAPTAACAVRIPPARCARSYRDGSLGGLSEPLGRLNARVRVGEADEGPRPEPVGASPFASLFFSSFISIGGSSSRVRDLRHDARRHGRAWMHMLRLLCRRRMGTAAGCMRGTSLSLPSNGVPVYTGPSMVGMGMMLLSCSSSSGVGAERGVCGEYARQEDGAFVRSVEWQEALIGEHQNPQLSLSLFRTHLIRWSLLNPESPSEVSMSTVVQETRAAALENCRDFTIQGGTFNVSSTTVDQPQGGEIPQFLPTSPFTVPQISAS